MSILARHGLRLPRVLLLASALMVVAMAAEWALLSRDPTTPGPARALPPQVASQVPAMSLPQAATFAEIAQRPLFNQTRRPEPPDRGRAGPPPARPNLILLGVVMTGNTRYALIRHGNPPKLEPLGEGQSVDGWEIQTITDDHVTLTSGSASADFALGGSNPAGAAGQAQPGRPLGNSWGGSPDP